MLWKIDQELPILVLATDSPKEWSCPSNPLVSTQRNAVEPGSLSPCVCTSPAEFCMCPAGAPDKLPRCCDCRYAPSIPTVWTNVRDLLKHKTLQEASSSRHHSTSGLRRETIITQDIAQSAGLQSMQSLRSLMDCSWSSLLRQQYCMCHSIGWYRVA